MAGFLDDQSPQRWGQEFCGARILGGREKLAEMRSAGIEHCLVAVGDCAARLSLAKEAEAAGFSLATAIHPRATVSPDVLVGAGTVVAAGSVVNPGTTIGRNVIVNTSASVDHECVVADGVHICPGVHLAGRVRIGQGTWIGIGSTVIEKVQIGANSIIGAGSLVLKDLPDNVIAYGSPASLVKARKFYEK